MNFHSRPEARLVSLPISAGSLLSPTTDTEFPRTAIEVRNWSRTKLCWLPALPFLEDVLRAFLRGAPGSFPRSDTEGVRGEWEDGEREAELGVGVMQGMCSFHTDPAG